MKIIHIITDLSTGGAQRALYNVLAGGLATRYDSAVISLRDIGTFGQRIKALGVPIYTLDIRGGVPGLLALHRLRCVVREFRPDVVQGWMYHGNIAANVARHMMPERPAVTWNIRHSLYSLDGEKKLTRLVIRAGRRLSFKADGILYNSRISKEQHETFGFDRSKSQVISNGFDLDNIGNNPSIATKIRSEFSIPKDAPVIGHVARYHPMKDHASFLRTAKRIAEVCAKAHFLVIGRDVSLDNPALEGIIPLAMSNRFHFTGERSDAQELMRAMDILCLSSAWGEAFPNVIGEAMARGVPCVATDVGDSRLIIGKTGIIVPPKDSDALFHGLMTMLNKSLKERMEVGQAARSHIEDNYSLGSVVEMYSTFYSGLAK